MKLLLTGAAGWLGLNVLHLARSARWTASLPQGGCRGLVLAGTPGHDVQKIAPDMELLQGDIRSPEDCRKLCREAAGGLLIHTAGIIHPQRIRDFYEINLEGTRNLLQAAVEAGVKRAVIVSSNSPIGCNPHRDHQFDEESPYHPYMNYGRSKMLMEMAVKDFQREGEIETVILRAPWFYGPFQPPRQTLFFQMIRDGKMPVVGDGNNLRSMAYTENLAQGILLAATQPQAAGETYWIADERPYPMNEIVDTVERLLEQEFGQKCAHQRMRLPGLASEVAWVLDKSLQAVGIYQQKIHVLSEMNKTIACTVEKARRDLGYRPEVSLEEGMRRSIQWCLENGQPI